MSDLVDIFNGYKHNKKEFLIFPDGTIRFKLAKDKNFKFLFIKEINFFIGQISNSHYKKYNFRLSNDHKHILIKGLIIGRYTYIQGSHIFRFNGEEFLDASKKYLPDDAMNRLLFNLDRIRN